MATAVTLKESDGTEIYPVTDISLVNNGIHAVDIEATTPVPAVETAMIADGAVTSAKIADGAITNNKIADGTITTSKLNRGYDTIYYYNTSAVTVTDATYTALGSKTITTHGGDIYVSGFVFGVKTGGGVTYLYVKIDDTEYRVSQSNMQGNLPLYASQIITGIPAGSHTVSFAVTIQSGTGRSYEVSGYSQDRMTFIEI